jgi:hypothetical protein
MDENLFDYEFYINLYEDLKNLTKEDAYNHYLTKGKDENRIVNKRKLYEIFDYEFYINLYDDVKTLGNKNEVFKHFINNGIHEERLINDKFNKIYDNFNWEFYIHICNLNIELFNTKYKTLLYYMQYNNNNIYDIHIFNKDLYKDYDNFDWEFYILLYDDLKNLNIDSKKKAYFHYIIFGKAENRIINKNINYEYKFENNIYKINYNYFNWESYISNNIDIININNKEDAFLHFIKYGINENRVYDENLCSKMNKFDLYFYSKLYNINLNILSEEDVYKHWIANKKILENERLIEKKTNFLNYKNDIFITFIIPTIGRESLIIAINSLFNLTKLNWNAIIIFDGVKKNININDERITIVELEKKEGLLDKYNQAGYVRNIGFSYLKKSDWVGFLDDDDSLSNDYIEKLENEVSLNSSIDVCIFRMIYENNIILPGKIDKSINKNRIGISFALKGCITNNIKFSNSQHEDYFYLKELEYKNYKIVISPYICYYVRMSQINNIDNQINNKNILDRIFINFD